MIREKKLNSQLVIDLTSPGSNAYALMVYADKLSKKLGIESAPILSEMTSGDYENLVNVFDKHFGKFVILER